MANNNRNVIVALFPSADKADMAANQIKDWDKANEDIKLGAIGIISMVDGKLETRKVGAKATESGAKAGVAIGIVAGILSGGITLLGGAVAGLVGGGVLGAFKHKNLGLSDGDVAQLQLDLEGGKVALVVTADDDEVYPTKAELESIGGTVSSYTADADAMQAIQLQALEASRQQQNVDMRAGTTNY